MHLAGWTAAFGVMIACAKAPAADVPATQPATQPASRIEPGLLKELTALDQRIGAIQDLRATFIQKKFTPLLRKPLLSAGTVRVKGTLMRWDTTRPEESIIAVGQGQLEMYYPSQKVLEVYQLDQQMGQLAASPLPRLALLRQYFSIERAEAAPLLKAWHEDVAPPDHPATAQAEAHHYLALRLTPIDPALQRHLNQVLVLMDLDYPCILRAEMAAAARERTVLSFSDIHLNTGLKEAQVTLHVPPGTTISHPLAGMERGGK
jgi:outer membrane lipoprotein-sorting protein